MRISKISFISGLGLIFFGALCEADDSSAPTPPNQNQVQVDKSAPKAGITGVQTQSAGPSSSQGSLDPSRQSSMGLGIQIPFNKKNETPPASNNDDTKGDASKP
jgi:hypothetical protein